MKLLFFSDVHLGIRSYSIQEENGIYSAEKDSRISLEAIYERSQQPDISLIIFGGDMTHTNTPTTENNKYLIDWFHRMDEIGKPFKVITGNHDCSSYSNSLVFLHKLKLKNTILIDKHDNNIIDTFGKYKIKYVPYVPNLSLKDKDLKINIAIDKAINESIDNTIIVSHLQERSCMIGSEARMISRGVDVVDTQSMDKNLIFLLGHIHRQQSYIKAKSTIVYSGSTIYADASDIGMEKGFIILDDEGKIGFEPVRGIRKFIKYIVPRNIQPIDYFSTIRLLIGSVVFINYSCENVNYNDLYKFFKERDCTIGHLTQQQEKSDSTNDIFITDENRDPYFVFKSQLERMMKESVTPQVFEEIQRRGLEKIEEYIVGQK